MALWIYLHFPSLQLDVMYKQEETKALPVIIVDDKSNEIVQLNSLAQREGIKVSMGLGTASSLCRDLQVKPYDQTIEQQTLKRIAHWLYSVTADIALSPPNGLLLKVSNMLALYQDLGHYWQVLSQHLNRLSINYQYASGYSPYAAKILATQQFNAISNNQNKLLNRLKTYTLNHSDLPPKVITSLQKVGVNRFADLLSLSIPELSKRFSADVVNYIGRLTGKIQHHVDFYIPPDRFEQYLELYYEVSNNLYLEKPLLKLYQLLEKYLQLRDKLASEVTIYLHQRDTDDLTLNVAAAQGEYKAEHWLQLTKLTLESTVLAAPVVGMTLKTKRLMNKYAQRTDLFQGSQGHLSPEELTSILSAKLGQDKVKGIQVNEDDRPEIANQLCTPFSTQAPSVIADKLRPNLLLPAPLPLNEQVTVMSHPERVITGWWDNNQVIRDYFIGRSNSGRWLWLFRDNNKRWFVHGVFS